MQVKVLSNILHDGVTHFVGAILDVDKHLQGANVEELKARGLITDEVTQNPAEQTPVQAQAEPQAPEQPEAPKEPEQPKEEEKKEGENGEQEQTSTGEEEAQEKE